MISASLVHLPVPGSDSPPIPRQGVSAAHKKIVLGPGWSEPGMVTPSALHSSQIPEGASESGCCPECADAGV